MDSKQNSFFYCKPSKQGRSIEKDRNLFRIFLSDPETSGVSYIYFIQPYSEFNEDIQKSKGLVIGFQFDYIQMHTEHKEILFNQTFLLSEYKLYKIRLNKEQYIHTHFLFQSILSEVKRKDANAVKCIISYLNIIYLNCQRLLKTNLVKREKHHYTNLLIVCKFRQLVYKFAKSERNVSFFANQLNLTPNYLNIVLKTVTGKNASTHIFNFVMIEAQYLLIHTKLSLKEVAFELGFADQSYFTRFFRKQSGLNPLDWFNKHM